MQQSVREWELRKAVHYSPEVTSWSLQGDHDGGIPTNMKTGSVSPSQHQETAKGWLLLLRSFYLHTSFAPPCRSATLRTKPQNPFRWDSSGQNVIRCRCLIHCFYHLWVPVMTKKKKRRKKVSGASDPPARIYSSFQRSLKNVLKQMNVTGQWHCDAAWTADVLHSNDLCF